MSENSYRTVINALTFLAVWLAVTAASLAVWASYPSSHFIKPQVWSYSADTQQVTFVREVREPVKARWAHEIITVDGLECSASGQTLYQPAENNTVRFPVPVELLPCLEGGVPSRSFFWWQVMAFGVVPLSPVEMERHNGEILR